MKIVISCFDLTTNLVQPWADDGYLCYCVDTQHPEGETREGNIIKVGADIMEWEPPRGEVVFAAFFPPCTDLAVSGARWFKQKELDNPGTRTRAMSLVYRSRDLAEDLGVPYFIENPVSVISSEWRKPDYKFDPCEYGGYLEPPGDAYTKKTCLWTGNGFVMPEVRPVDPTEGSRMHLVPPGPERANIRSATPMGFAIAVHQANRIVDV
jgi:hypothetical protein